MLNDTIAQMKDMLTAHHDKLNEALSAVLTMRVNNDEAVKENVKLKKDVERLKDLMSTFSHGLSGGVSSVIYAAEHGMDSKLLSNIGRTLQGMLDITSLVSYAPEKLVLKLQEDNEGENTLMHVLHKALWRVCIDFVSKRNVDRMGKFYFNFAKREKLISADTTFLFWRQEKAMRDIRATIRAGWELDVNKYSAPEDFDDLLAWCKLNLMCIRVFGVDSINRFSHAGVKESLLLVILTEMLFNAMKAYDTESTVPINLTWDDTTATVKCTNPTSENARNRGEGSGRGLNFLSLIAENVGGEFVPPSWDDNEVVTSFSFSRKVFS